MALVDFRGFRLTAMSLLPIGENTLALGSNDASKTIHPGTPQVCPVNSLSMFSIQVLIS